MLSNNTSLNILASYAYLRTSSSYSDMYFNLSKDGIINALVDSGAYTLFNAKQKKSSSILDEYCNFLDKYGEMCENYIALDVIGREKETKSNYEVMLKRGFNPMFVFTMFDNDYSYLKDAVKKNKNICVAGGITAYKKWMIKRYQDVFIKTNALIHGLGFVKYPTIFQLPLHSVDSSSWIQISQVYGSLCYYDNGIKGISYKDILVKKRNIDADLLLILEQLKITPKVFSNLSNHKGGRSIGTVLSVMAYIKYQKICKRNGINLFLAVANKAQLDCILYVNNEINKGTLTYEKYQTFKTSNS